MYKGKCKGGQRGRGIHGGRDEPQGKRRRKDLASTGGNLKKEGPVCGGKNANV